MNSIIGEGASDGVAMGVALVLPPRMSTITRYEVQSPEDELVRLARTRKEYTAELNALYDKTRLRIDRNTANIFMMYSMFLNDNEGIFNSEKKIREEHINAEYAVYCEMQRVSNIFAAIEDEYMRERSSDVENICIELILRLMGVHAPIVIPSELVGKFIVLFAENLTPASIIGIDSKRVGGVVISHGNKYSHTCILCRTLGIPAVVSVDIPGIVNGDMVMINGYTGEILINQPRKYYGTDET